MSSCLLDLNHPQEQDAPKQQRHRKRAVPGPDSNEPHQLCDEDYRLLNEDDVCSSPLKDRKKQKVDDTPPPPTAEELMQELREMPGMEQIAAQVKELLNAKKVDKFLRRNGMDASVDKICYNLILTGGSGTGKTTVARLIGRIFRASGFLSKGHMIEAGKGTLEGKHIGETAPKTQKVLESATGGVLFIDEAYSLAAVSDTSGGYGEEAIATMLPYMEDHRDDLVVIAAGYKDKIENLFLKMNDGLASRFPYRIDLPDYTSDQLMRIFIQMATKRKYQLTPTAKERLQQYLDGICEKHKAGSDFGNARFVRNLLDKAISSIAQRVVPLLPSDASDKPLEESIRMQLLTIEAEDIEDAIQKTANW